MPPRIKKAEIPANLGAGTAVDPRFDKSNHPENQSVSNGLKFHGLEIGLAPMPKKRPRFNSDQGRAYHDDRYTKWLAEAVGQLQEQWQQQPPITRTQKVTIQLWGHRRGDCDNLAGAVLDSLVKAEILADDSVSVIDHLVIGFEPSKKPRIEIEIEVAA